MKNNEMQELYETVMDRKANPEEGSYTAYLFGKGEEKILKKSARSARKSLSPRSVRTRNI
ncbi:hypothetical protein [Allobaculum sp. Allo2]|uniref:hypothetical protein n=1 Tax=Allobaculum sp. Allo2 TaxID=2853432 RepID=UPI00272E964F|nr:hypothetical protein [Allobaculum sp. Allo2]